MASGRLARLALGIGPVALALALAGCAGSPWAGVLPLLLWAISLVVAGCSESHGPGTPCCIEADGEGFGRVSSCHCPAGAACNYAPFADCGEGTCRITVFGGGTCVEASDAGGDASTTIHPPPTDAGRDAPAVDAGPDAEAGTWEACCETGSDGIGHVSTCFCPAGWACNYGWFVSCGGDTCAFSDCPDAGLADDSGGSSG